MPLLFLLLSLLCLPLNAGGVAEGPAVLQTVDQTRIFTDFMDRSVTIPRKIDRIISLTPGITEIIFSLGADSRLVGRTDYCDYPAGVSSVPSIGSMTEPNLELIVESEPDVVLAGTHFTEQTLHNLESAGIPVVILSAQESFEGVYRLIEAVGEITDLQSRAAELTTAMKTREQEITRKVSKLKEKKTVYYVVGYGASGDWTAGGDTFIHQMITMAGGINIAAEVKGWSFSRENIIEADPDLIIIPDYMKDDFMNQPLYSELNAVKSGHVKGINESTIVRQGPRLIDGLTALYTAITE